MMRHVFVLLAVLVLGGNVVSAQVRVTLPPVSPAPLGGQDADLIRAQEYEQQKQYDRARELYERLYERDGTDLLFWRLVMLYERTGNFDAMAVLAGERLESRPNDLSLLRYLARAYFGQGNDSLARETLNRIIGGRWNEEQRVYLAANELESHGDLGGIVTLYTTARERTGNDEAYAAELGSAYSLLNRYDDAAAEYLKLIDQSPETFAMAIQELLNDREAAGQDTGAIIAALERHLDHHPGSIGTAKLLSDRRYRDGDIAGAYETLAGAAVLADAPGALWALATQLQDEGHDSMAIRAFGDFYEAFAEDDRRIEALFAAAELRNRTGDTTGATRDYSRLIDAYPGSEIAAVASFRLIGLNRDTMSEEGYRTALEAFAGGTSYRTIAYAAYLQLATHVLQQGDFDMAGDVFAQASRKARTADERYELYRRQAFMQYYRADFPAMITAIDLCMQYGPGESDINDLLELKLLTRRLASPADFLHLAAIGRARFALFREDRVAATDSLKAVANNAGPLLAPYAAMELGGALVDDDPASAIEWYIASAAADTDSTRRAAALIHAADIAAETPDAGRAEELYMQALTISGGTLYDSEIRRKLRKVMER